MEKNELLKLLEGETKYKELYEKEKREKERLIRIIEHMKINIRDFKMCISKNDPENSQFKKEYEKEHDEIQRKLDIINSFEIIETDADSDGMIYALIENNKDNLNKLREIFSDEDIAESCGIRDIRELEEEDSIDICMLAFSLADYYYKGVFYQLEDIQVKE